MALGFTLGRQLVRTGLLLCIRQLHLCIHQSTRLLLRVRLMRLSIRQCARLLLCIRQLRRRCRRRCGGGGGACWRGGACWHRCGVCTCVVIVTCPWALGWLDGNGSGSQALKDQAPLCPGGCQHHHLCALT